MNESNRRRAVYKAELKEILDRSPEAKKVENRYLVIAQVLAKEYPNFMNATSKEVILKYLQDTVYLDRKLRLETEGDDEDVKLEKAQEVAEEIRTGNF